MSQPDDDGAGVQLELFPAPPTETRPSHALEPEAPGREERQTAVPQADTVPTAKAQREQRRNEDQAKAEALRRRLEAELGSPVDSVVLTRNRTRIVSAQRGTAGLRVRIHRCFARTDLEVGESDELAVAVAEFLSTRSKRRRTAALARIREHFETHGRHDVHPIRAPTLKAQGRFHDLEALRDRVNADYFDNRVDVRITWGRGAHGGGVDLQAWRNEVRKLMKSRVRKSATRSRFASHFHIRLGSYHDRDRLVRIHPVLDQAHVPAFVVESIVYHEMLHQVVPPIPGPRRRLVHTPEFRRRERLYAQFDEAEAWLAQNLERLARERF